jgi:2-polyprenyl-6-methoxyphenol hydroxylase-like FAD-dependent oxidoreductase
MAIGVMPPSLRIFEAIGLAAPLIQAGCAVRTAVVHDPDSTLGVVDFSSLPAPFPFILSLPQDDLMQLLATHLAAWPAVTLLDGCEATAVRQGPGSVTVDVRDLRDGTRRALGAAFAVACDGHDSAVRRLLGIPAAGKRYPVSFVMGDFPETTPWGSEAHLFFTPAGSLEAFPLPGGRRRWIALADGPERDGAALAGRTGAITGFRLRLEDEIWHSAFTPERRLARAFFRNRVVLCGDAAHIMSPIGGQGMNTGFADAWVLARVLRRLLATGESPEPSFARYQAERCRAFRIAANRAGAGMWLGTRTGRVPSALRACLIRHVLLGFPLSRQLPRRFAMLTPALGRHLRPDRADPDGRP